MTITLVFRFILSNYRHFTDVLNLGIQLPKIVLQFSVVLQFLLYAIEIDRHVQRRTWGLGGVNSSL